jgi:metal iron transporter
VQVIGSAIALNLLLHVPLVAGCAITIVDVLVILLFYKPNGSMGAIRAFEWFVAAIVLGVVICFSVELSLIQNASVREVFRGYLPSAAVIESNGYGSRVGSQAVLLTDCAGCISVAASLVRR